MRQLPIGVEAKDYFIQIVTEHLTPEQLHQYHRRTLPRGEVIAVDEHLSSCAICHRHFVELYDVPNKSSEIKLVWTNEATEFIEHLDFDSEIVPYVDGQLNDIDCEIVESHLELCRQCTKDVSELKAFKAEIEAVPSNDLSVESTPIPASIKTRWNKRWRLSAVYATALAAMAVLVAASVLWREDSSLSLVQQETSAPPIVDTAAYQPPVTALPSGEAAKTPVQSATPSDDIRAKPEPMLLALNDNSQTIGVTVEGELIGVDKLSPSARDAVTSVLRSGQISKPKVLEEVSSQQLNLRGNQDKGEVFGLITPVGKVVKETSPVLRWQPLPGATGYSVIVLDAEFNRVASSSELSANQWKVEPALKRGTNYQWFVTAVKDGEQVKSPRPPASPAMFKILDEKSFIDLERADKQVGSNLAMGILYARMGLLDDAEREFKALRKENPKSPFVRKLLRDVESWRD